MAPGLELDDDDDDDDDDMEKEERLCPLCDVCLRTGCVTLISAREKKKTERGNIQDCDECHRHWCVDCSSPRPNILDGSDDLHFRRNNMFQCQKCDLCWCDNCFFNRIDNDDSLHRSCSDCDKMCCLDVEGLDLDDDDVVDKLGWYRCEKCDVVVCTDHSDDTDAELEEARRAGGWTPFGNSRSYCTACYERELYRYYS